MNEGKKGAPNNPLTCNVCKIDFNSNADFALHEFSKKHCDNLIRLAKQKPITVKQKTKNEAPEVEKPQPKVNSVTHSGSFAKYGYFVPGEVYVSSEASKEFNTDYDPYLQKFAENPFKEKPNIQPQHETTTFGPVTSFKKVKKKKIKMCQVCNITLVTLPEYEAHMKSPQHIWKLKVTGMGVSAHFVKASTDLHTTDINEESEKVNKEDEATAVGTTLSAGDSSSGPFPLLFCSDCELLLNSPQQYNTHINGKIHSECVQKKAELKAKREKLENPPSDQLFCYSCKISLNNLNQYNEHKNGKKHKTKCRALMRKGITIPPEERFPELPHPNYNRPVIYPELYEKLVLEKEKQNPVMQSSIQSDNLKDTEYSQITQITLTEGLDVQTNFEENGVKDAQHSAKSNKVLIQEQSSSGADFQPEVKISQENNKTVEVENWVPTEVTNSTSKMSNLQTESAKTFQPKTNETEKKEELTNQVCIITDGRPMTCSICSENFDWQTQLDAHLSKEEHYKEILELKMSGRKESEILSTIFSDRRLVKPSNFGKFSCSICNVATDNSFEFDQHLTTVVHKYAEKDYRNKRTVEVKNMVKCNESGLYFCKLCQEGWQSLVEYTQHLHLVKHKNAQRAQRAKMISEKRKNFRRNLQRVKNYSVMRVKSQGMRNKTFAVATDADGQAPIQDQKPPETKVESIKNVCDQNTKNDNNAKVTKMKKRTVKHRTRGRFPFIPSVGSMQPRMPCTPFPRYLRPGFIPDSRIRYPFFNPRPPFGAFCGAPPIGNPHFRPQRFLRPSLPRILRFPY